MKYLIQHHCGLDDSRTNFISKSRTSFVESKDDAYHFCSIKEATTWMMSKEQLFCKEGSYTIVKMREVVQTKNLIVGEVE